MLTQALIDAMVARWRKHYAPSTAHTRVWALRKLLDFIETTTERRLAVKAPRLPRGDDREIIAAPGEIDRLAAQAPPWMRLAIFLAAHTGLRVSDVLALSPMNYNAASQTITFAQKKTGKKITLPVSAQTRDLLDNAPEAPAETPYLEAFARGPVNYNRFLGRWRILKQQAGVNRELTFHDLRRTLAVRVYDSSGDLRLVQQALGHRNLHSTIKYLAHKDPNKLKPILDLLSTQTPRGPVQ